MDTDTTHKYPLRRALTHNTHAQYTHSVYGAVTEDVTCVQMVMEFAEHGDLRGMDTFANIQGSIMDTSGTSEYVGFADKQVAKT